MKTLTRWNPLREMMMFDPFAENRALWGEPLPFPNEPEPMMRLDVTETGGEYVVKAEIPGVAKEDISVSLDGGMVSISAEVKREKDVKEGEKAVRSERYFGRVARSFTLPAEIVADKAFAAYEGGVLTLKLPKAPGVTSREIAIH